MHASQLPWLSWVVGRRGGWGGGKSRRTFLYCLCTFLCVCCFTYAIFVVSALLLFWPIFHKTKSRTGEMGLVDGSTEGWIWWTVFYCLSDRKLGEDQAMVFGHMEETAGQRPLLSLYCLWPLYCLLSTVNPFRCTSSRVRLSQRHTGSVWRMFWSMKF